MVHTASTPAELLAALHAVLPSAGLRATAVPLLATDRPFGLWLIDDNFCHQDLTPTAIERLWAHCPYWVFAWASGQVLARYILSVPHTVAGKVVLDFGAGSGIVGIAAKRAGAREVICCDIDPVSLLACQANAALNGETITPLDDLYALPNLGMDKVDVLCMADVLYDAANVAWLDSVLPFADTVWLADSRLKNLAHPRYQRVAIIEQTTTLPDMDEAHQFNRVTLYQTIC